MRCHYVYDPEFGKIHIPYCWGAVMHGPEMCSCYKNEFREIEREEVRKLKQEIKDLEKENARLYRIIRKVYKNEIQEASQQQRKRSNQARKNENSNETLSYET